MIGIGRLSTLLKAAIAALIYKFKEKRKKNTDYKVKFSDDNIISRSKIVNACIRNIQTSGSSMIAGLTPTAYNGRIL
jgi:Ni,Fe-hydrogenase III large subunit